MISSRYGFSITFESVSEETSRSRGLGTKIMKMISSRYCFSMTCERVARNKKIEIERYISQEYSQKYSQKYSQHDYSQEHSEYSQDD